MFLWACITATLIIGIPLGAAWSHIDRRRYQAKPLWEPTGIFMATLYLTNAAYGVLLFGAHLDHKPKLWNIGDLEIPIIILSCVMTVVWGNLSEKISRATPRSSTKAP